MSYAYDPNFPDFVPADEEAASLSTLALAPWVAVRAAAVRESHYESRRRERPALTETKVGRWRRGVCQPRTGSHK